MAVVIYFSVSAFDVYLGSDCGHPAVNSERVYKISLTFNKLKIMNNNIIAEIKPQQLSIYLMFAIMYAKEHNCKLEIAENINKELMKVTWDDDAELLIIEKPF